MSITLIIVFFIVILAWVTAEFYIRKYYGEKLIICQSPLIYEPSKHGGYRYRPNSNGDLIGPYRRTHFEVNEHGFLGKSFSKEKPEGIFRVMLVGYSMLSEENGHIDRALSSMDISNVQVINCCLDGKGLSWHQFQFIKRELVNYDPDLVLFNSPGRISRSWSERTTYRGYVIQYPTGDQSSRVKAQRCVDRILKNKIQTFLFDHSFILRAINKKLRLLYMKSLSSSSQKRLDHFFLNYYLLFWYSLGVVNCGLQGLKKYDNHETRNMLEDLFVFLNTRNIGFALYDYFDPVGKENRSTCAALGIPYLNLGIQYKDFGASMVIQENDHPNQKGIETISHLLAKKLLDEHLIPQAHLSQSREQGLEVS